MTNYRCVLEADIGLVWSSLRSGGLDCGCQKVDSNHQIEFLTDVPVGWLHLEPHHHPSMPSQNRNGKTYLLLPLKDEFQYLTQSSRRERWYQQL